MAQKLMRQKLMREIKIRIPRDFPQEAVQIGKIAGIAAPIGVARGFHNYCADALRMN